MIDTTWLAEHMEEIIQYAGIIGGLFFTGYTLRTDSKVRQAETLIEINKQHRELWLHFYENRQLAQIFNSNRDISTHPLADEEVHFVNFLINHLYTAFFALKSGIYVPQKGLPDDIRRFFSYPSVKTIWTAKKHLYDDDFQRFIERSLAESGKN